MRIIESSSFATKKKAFLTGSKWGTKGLQIELHLYASFKKFLPEGCGENACHMDVEEGTTVKDLLGKLHIPLNAPKVIFLNGIHAKGEEILKDGDRLGAFPPVAGG
jgi:sulfur-carrier protein